jgi:excisionase family DNA binding protein
MTHRDPTYAPDRRLLTRSQAAANLAVNVRTLARLLAAGELPCVRIGRAVRIRADDLDEFIERRRSPTGRS